MWAMAIAVYSRVGRVLEAHEMSLEDLQSQLASRYDVRIDARSLEELIQDGRVQRPDIEIFEAIAAILRVRLDDLLDARAVVVEPDSAPTLVPAEDVRLDPEDERRLSDLIRLRDWGDHPLTEAEERELEALTAPTARALIDRDIAALASAKGISIATARAQVEDAARDVADFWSALTSDPALMAAEIDAARARRQARGG